MIIYNGQEYARVSEILAPFSNYSQINPKVLERKQVIGTNVHEGILEYLRGGFPILTKEEYKYFCSFQRWSTQIKPIYIIKESRYFDHKRMISGQVDGVVRLPGEKLPILIDYKTSASVNEVAWPMQAHLYAELLKVNGIEVQPRYLFLKLRKEGGNPGVHEYKFDENTHNKCMVAIENFWSQRKN